MRYAPLFHRFNIYTFGSWFPSLSLSVLNPLPSTMLSRLDVHLVGNSQRSVTKAAPTRLKLALPQHSWFWDELLRQRYTAGVKKASLLPESYSFALGICLLSVLWAHLKETINPPQPPQVAQLIQPIKAGTGACSKSTALKQKICEAFKEPRQKKARLLFWSGSLQELRLKGIISLRGTANLIFHRNVMTRQ